MALDFDLLGDPIPENFGKRGRPPHIPTDENRSKIRVLLAFGWTDTRIAAALRITKPTLKKHYFRELRFREEARDALKAKQLMLLCKAAEAGNAAAIKELGNAIERDELARINPAPKPDTAKEEKLGKKIQADLEAQSGHRGTAWEDLVRH